MAIDFGDKTDWILGVGGMFKWSWRFRIMSELRINNITDRAGSSGPIIAGVSTVTSTSHMVMPSGEQKCVVVEEGQWLLVVTFQLSLWNNGFF